MRFGLFGTGPWAHLAHAPGLADHPGVEFTGIWGRDQAKAGALAAEHGTRAWADADELIAAVDAVAVALPPEVQAPLALRAAGAGRHLLLDKPVALRTEEADAIAAAVDAGGLASVVFFTRRFVPANEQFVAETAATGGWSEARIDHLGSIFTPDNPFGASPWRRASGGLWDVGPHALAQVLPILGPVTEVTGLAGERDLTFLLLRHEGGAVSRLTLAVDAPAAAAREEAVFAGESGVRPVPAAEWDPVRALGRALDQLIAAAAGGPQPECDIHLGATVTRILVAAEQAIAEGRTVRVS